MYLEPPPRRHPLRRYVSIGLLIMVVLVIGNLLLRDRGNDAPPIPLPAVTPMK